MRGIMQKDGDGNERKINTCYAGQIRYRSIIEVSSDHGIGGSSFIGVFRETAVSMLLYIFGWGVVIYCYFRIFSRNVQKRYAENQAYLMKTYKIRNWFQNQKNIWQQRKVYHIYTCPSCKQKIRIPKGKGKIEVRCPKCGTTFIKKS